MRGALRNGCQKPRTTLSFKLFCCFLTLLARPDASPAGLNEAVLLRKDNKQELYRICEVEAQLCNPNTTSPHSSSPFMRELGSSLAAMRHCLTQTILTRPLCEASARGTLVTSSSSRKT